MSETDEYRLVHGCKDTNWKYVAEAILVEVPDLMCV